MSAPAQAAALIHTHFALGARGSLLLCNPIPAEAALAADPMERALTAALAAAAEGKVAGKHLTPFLLARVAQETGRQSVHANIALLLHNARTAAEIAVALAAHPGWQSLAPWRKSAS